MKCLNVSLFAGFVSVLLVLSVSGCSKTELETWGDKEPQGIKSAVAVLSPVGNSKANGTVTFTKSSDAQGIRVFAQPSGNSGERIACGVIGIADE